LPRIERKIEIEAPQKNIFNILNDTMIGPKWNLAVNDVTKISENEYAVKSTVGDFNTIRTETLEPEKLSMDIKGGIFSSMGYILKSKENMVEVTLWGEFDDEKNEKVLVKAGEILLKCLKSYAEFIEEGGNPDDFDKKQIMVTP
jgi:hypothetical protein